MTQEHKLHDTSEFPSVHRADDGSPAPFPGRPIWGLAAAFVAIGAIVGTDIASDWAVGTSATHLWTEGAVLLISALAVVALARTALTLRRQARHATLELARVRVSSARDVDAARAEAERWRSETSRLLAGLGAAIDQQFERWRLTAAEKEVALLLLKGLSLKEVAATRSTSERTARQQSLSVYAKSGLGGRAELAAFFLEDLLLPSGSV